MKILLHFLPLYPSVASLGRYCYGQIAGKEASVQAQELTCPKWPNSDSVCPAPKCILSPLILQVYLIHGETQRKHLALGVKIFVLPLGLCRSIAAPGSRSCLSLRSVFPSWHSSPLSLSLKLTFQFMARLSHQNGCSLREGSSFSRI